MHLTLEPDFTSFLKISNETSSLEKISVISFIIKGFLKSGLSLHILIKLQHMKF